MESYLFLSSKFEELFAADRKNAAQTTDKAKEKQQMIENLQRSSLYKDLKERMEKEAMARELANALHEIDENAQNVASSKSNRIKNNATDSARKAAADGGGGVASSKLRMDDESIAMEAMIEASLYQDLPIHEEVPEIAGNDVITSIFTSNSNDFQARFAAAMQAPAEEFEKAARRLTQSAVRSSYNYNVKATGNHECSLCLISFDHADELHNHIEKSEFHQQKLAQRNKRIAAAQEEALRLAHVATKVCSEMQEGGLAHSALEQNKERLLVRSKVLWRKAVKKVVVEHITNQFVKRLEHRVEVPNGVKLLHSSSKHFHRIKATYDLQILLHLFDSCIEIVPHLVPYNHKTGEYNASGHVLPCPRMYLSYIGVQMAMMGIDISEAKLTFTSNFGDSTKKRQLGKSFLAAESEAVITYIFNRLKVNPAAASPTEALYYDNLSVNAEVLLAAPPEGMEEVVVRPDVIHLAWIEKHAGGASHEEELNAAAHLQAGDAAA